MDLDNLKYNELQKLAKSAGIKANMKVEKLVKALKDYYNTQGHSNTNTQSTGGGDTSQPGVPKSEKDESPAPEEDQSGQMKKKVAARGRKRGQKKGTRGKTKSNSSSEESQEEMQRSKSETPKTNTSFTKPATSKTPQQGTSSGRQTPTLKRTPQVSTPSVKRAPSLTKPLTARTPQTGTPGVKKTPTIVRPVSGTHGAKKTPTIVKPVSAKTPLGQTGTKQTQPGAKVASGKSTPVLCSPKPRAARSSPSSAGARNVPAKRLRDSGGAKRDSKSTPVSVEDKSVLTIPGKTSGQKRKRTSTFELEEPTLGAPATPEVGQAANKSQVSPGIQGMLDSMSGELNSAERRKRLMRAIEKKVEGKVKSSPCTGAATQIPRFAAFLAKRKEEQKKPITPGNKDWEKVHKKEFSKFDSIDVYLAKKRKRAEEMMASEKKARTVLHEVQEAVSKLKSKRTPSLGKRKAAQPFKPSVMSTKDMNLNFVAAASSAKDQKSTSTSKVFKPTVTSTKDINLNFSSYKTPVNQKAVTKQQAPVSGKTNITASARKSAGASQMSTRKSLGAAAAAAKKSVSTTPFHFTGTLDLSEARSTSKPVFDLKASLARPITWKLHTGKLKPMDTLYMAHGKGAEHSATKPTAPSRMDIFKSAVNRTRVTYSRQDKRAAVAAKRAEKKSSVQMRRRGIVVP